MPIFYSGSSLIISSSGLGPTEAYVPLPVPTSSYDQIYFYFKARVDGDYSPDSGANTPTAWSPVFYFGLSYETASLANSVNTNSGSAANPKIFGILNVPNGQNPQIPTQYRTERGDYSRGVFVNFVSDFYQGPAFYIPSISSSIINSSQEFLGFPTGSSPTNRTNVWKLGRNFGGNSIYYNIASTTRSFSDIRELKQIPRNSPDWVSMGDLSNSNNDLSDYILSGSQNGGFNSPRYIIIRNPDPFPNRKLIIDQICVEWIDSSRKI